MPNAPAPATPVITYTWGIAQLECAPSEDSLTNVVKTIHWTLIAEDGTYVASSYGSVGLASPDGDEFIAYNDLTKETAINWVKAALNTGDEDRVSQMEAALAANIEDQRNPKIVRPAVPWGN